MTEISPWTILFGHGLYQHGTGVWNHTHGTPCTTTAHHKKHVCKMAPFQSLYSQSFFQLSCTNDTTKNSHLQCSFLIMLFNLKSNKFKWSQISSTYAIFRGVHFIYFAYYDDDAQEYLFIFFHSEPNLNISCKMSQLWWVFSYPKL